MPAIDTLLMDHGPGETRVAALSGGSVVEVHVHRQRAAHVNAVYRGRIVKSDASSGLCFVDIGQDEPAIMSRSATVPSEGSEIDVRVVQAPRWGRGAKVAPADKNVTGTCSHGRGEARQTPYLIEAAESPIIWCANSYKDNLKSVVIAPSDVGRCANVIREIIPALDVTISPDDIFFEYGVDEAIEQALETSVPVPGGATVVIETTAALTAIDIDAGPMPAHAANAASISVIARQLRLRSIGGPVIVDLIPTRGRNALVKAMKAAVAEDPVRTQVSGLTPEGRLELNRRRLRPALAEYYLRPAPAPERSVEGVAYELVRRATRDARATGSVSLSVRCHPRVIDALHGPLRFALDEAEDALKTPLAFNGQDSWTLDQFDIDTG